MSVAGIWPRVRFPEVAPECLRLGAKLSARQWSAVRMLEHLAVDRNFSESVSAADMGRAASKVEDFA